MMRKKFLLYLLGILLLSCKFLDAGAIANPSLRKEILEMRDLDQKVREECIISNFDAANVKRVETVDRLHFGKLEAIIQAYGWPGHELVGEEGSNAMWLLVQHASTLEFQKKCLSLLQDAVAKGDASPIDSAYLQDRILMKEGKKQLYGTQWKNQAGKHFLYPLNEPSQVNERRLAIGLNSLEDSRVHYMKAYQLTEEDLLLESDKIP